MTTCINCERLKSEISIIEADIARLTAECETEAKAAAIAIQNADDWSGNLDIVEAERDELKRRMDAVVAMLEPGERPTEYQYAFDLYPKSNFEKALEKWKALQSLCSRAKAIAEGRDDAAP